MTRRGWSWQGLETDSGRNAVDVCGFQKNVKKGKCSPYSIAERRVPERPVLGSQPADVSHKPGDGLPLLPPGLQLPLQPLRGSLPVSLLGE